MTAQPKEPRIIRYLLDAYRKVIPKQIPQHRVPPSPPGRTFIPRLTHRTGPSIEYSVTEICSLLQSQLQDAIIFCDTSLFDNITDPALWPALLQIRGRLTLVEPVYAELEPWITRNPQHVAARAVFAGEPWVRMIKPTDFSSTIQDSMMYYVNLLSIRRQLLAFDIEVFKNENNRHPTADELRRIKVELSENVGPRAYHLAKKGFDERQAQPRYTDEVLICTAFINAILTGRETVILTKDYDLLEQFYKLQWLLDTHYRAFLLAQRIRADEGAFVRHPLPSNDPRIGQAFITETGYLLERSDRLLSEILPDTCNPVILYCYVMGERLSQMAFCAETGLRQLLEMKGRTGGLNTNQLDGRNCHIWLAPLNVPQKVRGCAAIVTDVRMLIPMTNVRIPYFDIMQAIFCGETIEKTFKIGH